MIPNGSSKKSPGALHPTAAGLYVHVPFCLRKCPYCDFYSVTELGLKKDYLRSLVLEMDRVSADWSDFFFDSLYFGGGTPSLLTPDDVGETIRHIRDYFRLSRDVEITLEANPGTVDAPSFLGYRKMGVNRLNIGVQSFSPRNLAFLGRIHTVADAASALEGASRAGFENIGIDLIYGLPDQTKKEWVTDLKTAVAFDPSHLSCYLLSYEPGTILHSRRQVGEFHSLPQKRQAELFMATAQFLEAHGFVHYEISNFAKMRNGICNANRSRHNQKYWDFTPYIGLGPGAHSYRENERVWNVKSIEKYLDMTLSGCRPLEGREVLSANQQRMEAVYLGLRRREGISRAEFEGRFGPLFFSGDTLKTAERLEREGLAGLSPDRFALTRQGMLLLDSIAEALITHMP